MEEREYYIESNCVVDIVVSFLLLTGSQISQHYDEQIN
jgi:hypothetical protein